MDHESHDADIDAVIGILHEASANDQVAQLAALEAPS
jgi:hypothetical protein